jgi:dTDP-4-amino-4,6-dideoxygalactose transaminase
MINLFHLNNYTVKTSKYSNLLHDKVVTEFESKVAEYVGAKYAVTFNSATSAIFLSLLNKNITVDIPSMIPPVVANAIFTSNNKYNFIDNVDWVGDSYLLHNFGDYKIIDSAQKLKKNQFATECNDNDLMIFSFYPTKPVGSCDGGMIVSNDFDKINHLREMALNGMSFSKNNWERKINFIGYKMYMNSIQCDIALNNFKKYDEKLDKLYEIKSYYNKELNYANTSDHLYRIEVNDRNKFINYMKNNGITCGIHYESLHLNPVYAQPNSSCPNSEIKSTITVSIPFHEKLTKRQISFIISKIRNYESIK